MDMSRETLNMVFDQLEAQGMTEEEILEEAVSLAIYFKSDVDLLYELNDLLYERGYSFIKQIIQLIQQINV